MEPAEPINVLVAAPPTEVDALTAMLNQGGGLALSGAAHAAADAAGLVMLHQPDVLVLDDGLPGADLPALSREALKVSPALQIVVVSGENEAGAIRAAMRAGARDYLIKPLQPGELTETIHWLIRERRDFARMQGFVKKLRKAYELLFWDDKPIPPNVVTFLEAQAEQNPTDRLTLEALAVAYARNRDWAHLAPLAEHLSQ